MTQAQLDINAAGLAPATAATAQSAPATRAAVQLVFTLTRQQRIRHAVQLKAAFSDTVGVTAH